MISVNVPAGSTVTGQDLMDSPERLISGVVMYDVDKNGSGDNPVGDVTVLAVDSFGNTVSVSTDNTGVFSFSGLFPGVYDVRVTGVPDGYGLPADVSVDTSVGDMTDIEIVLPGSRTISGYVMRDVDYDGDGDEGLEGATVILMNTGNIELARQTIGSNGLYTFHNTIPQHYKVGFTNFPAGYTPQSNIAVDTILGDATVRDIIPTGTRMLMIHTRADSTYSDARLEGSVIQLMNKEGDVVDQERTSSTGYVQYYNLIPEIHEAKLISVPNGWAMPSTTEVSIDLSTTSFGQLVWTLGGSRSINGSVKIYGNGDGSHGTGVSGVFIEAINMYGKLAATMITGTDGVFDLSGIGPQLHTLSFIMPGGYTPLAEQQVDVANSNIVGLDLRAFRNGAATRSADNSAP